MPDFMQDIGWRLRLPLPESRVEWKVQSAREKGATVLAYIDARGVQERMDEVFGPGGWSSEISFWESGYVGKNRHGHDVPPTGGAVCKLSALVDGQWVAKTDVAPFSDFEAFKGAASGALKRAAVHWGIGRYLYDLSATKVYWTAGGSKAQKFNGQWVNWEPPLLPTWALPAPELISGDGVVIRMCDEEDREAAVDAVTKIVRAGKVGEYQAQVEWAKYWLGVTL